MRTKIQDEQIVQMTCESLKLAPAVHGRHKVYTREVEGLAVRLRGWHHPVVFDLKNNEAAYDNFGGNWGAQSELDRFNQEYVVQNDLRAISESGMYVEERETLPDGSVRLRVPVYA